MPTLLKNKHLTIVDIHNRLRTELGYQCSYSTVRRAVRSIEPQDSIWATALDHISTMQRSEAVAFLRHVASFNKLARAMELGEHFEAPLIKWQYGDEVSRNSVEWLRAVSNNDFGHDSLDLDLNNPANLGVILGKIHSGALRERNKGLSVLARARGISGRLTCQYLGISGNTYRSYNQKFQSGGCGALFVKQRARQRKCEAQPLKDAVFGLLHEPPSKHGFNRASWRMVDLTAVLKRAGHPACPSVVREITKAAGYRWRKAKTVLTSHDPDYSAKLKRVQDTLRHLRPDEAFFSIDEFGPFAVKAKPGRILVPLGEIPIVEQWQKSRGCLILTAALELSGNQVTHFYSAKKNTDEMIKMMGVLLATYRDRSRIFLSWDAASWHMSRKLAEVIDAHNREAEIKSLPTVELVPLPASAQFLNVIESVFSGMARAIIHNSNYATAGDAINAIDRHFLERNAHFLANPKRAGKKIWGMEREPPVFSPTHNCKDPAFR